MKLVPTLLTLLLSLFLLHSHVVTATSVTDHVQGSSSPLSNPDSDQDHLAQNPLVTQHVLEMQISNSNSNLPVDNSYIVEIDPPTTAGLSGSVEQAISDAVDKLIENVKQAHPEAELKHVYKSELFTGASFKVGDETTKSHLQRIQEVK
ncbi:BQ2448_1709 [Microbotryum intermedium]|uniref:BQ2448_1709 protein n=1 Tax=Microbotryum intermedium TaxID=269621 RepID=A0A238FAT0_9BASI|nr:BQ2448_1709 [Microbotryum intermedium]